MHNEMKAFSIILLFECDNLNKNSYYNQAYELIDKWRKKKTDKYTTQEDKNLSVGVGLLINKLCKEYNIDVKDIIYDKHNKPIVLQHNLYLSISHANKYAMVALSSKPIGVDIEVYSTSALEIADHFYTDDEKQYLNQFTNEKYLKKFFDMWSAKECMIKRDGIKELRDFSMLKPINNGIFTYYNVDGYSCVCYSDKDIPVEYKIVNIEELLNSTKP